MLAYALTWMLAQKGTRVRIAIPPAMQSEVQRIPPGLLWKLQEMGAISRYLLANRTGESVLTSY